MPNRNYLLVIAVVFFSLPYFVLTACIAGKAKTIDFQASRFADAHDGPIPGWTDAVFQLSQQYPKALPPPENYPWQSYNFMTQWKEYLIAVRDYCYEGNINDDVDWVVQKNKVRCWYHTPWLHWGRNGREFVHGLTHERVSEPQELAYTQTSRFQNWAVSMYNAPGGYTIGQVWRDSDAPDPSAAIFPEGTVSVKLLFTQASVDQVPYLIGSKEWKAHIYREIAVPTNPLLPRVIDTLRLLQLDVAVKDMRSPTGWVFGTFVYNGMALGDTAWKRMVPVGLMWGNDPDITVAMVRGGQKLAETVLSSSAEVPYQHLGWGGRLAGPVDNPVSSCLSCHSVSQWPPDPDSPLVPPRRMPDKKPIEFDSKEWLRWFRNIKSDEPFTAGPGRISLRYSLQLMVGLQNFCEWRKLVTEKGGFVNSGKLAPPFLIDRAVNDPGNIFRRKYPISREGIPDEIREP